MPTRNWHQIASKVTRGKIYHGWADDQGVILGAHCGAQDDKGRSDIRNPMLMTNMGAPSIMFRP